MADNMSNLFQALQMFQNGVKEAATTSAVNDATQAMQDINLQITDEAQKRQSLQQLANQTALRLTGTGASGTQIQSAFNAINPQNFGSVEQMQLEAGLTGNQHYGKVASEILSQRKKAKQEEMQMEFGFKNALADKQFARDIALEEIKARKAAGNKPLSQEEVAFKTNFNVANKMLDDLEQTINDKGTFELGFGTEAGKRASAKLDSLPYQLAITYAKIVDPNSVAREGEVEAAKKYMLQLGLFSNEGKAKEGIQNMRDTLKSYFDARGQAQAVGASPTTSMGTPASSPVETKRLKDGSLVKVRKLPDGSYEKVD